MTQRASLEQHQQLFGATCFVKLQRCDVPTTNDPTSPPSPSYAQVSIDSPAVSQVEDESESETGSGSVSDAEEDKVKVLPAPPPVAPSSKKELSARKSPAYCRVCGMTLSSQICLKAHMRKHTEPNRYSCDNCGRSFWSLTTFRKHQKARDERNGVCSRERGGGGNWRPKGAWQCNICGKRMKYPDSYEPHLEKHGINLNPFKCGDCGKGFSKRYQLTRHKRIHSGVWQYSCVFCDKGFHKQDNLFCHLRGHTEEKPYFCEVKACGACYRQLRSLKHHRRTAHLTKIKFSFKLKSSKT